MKKNKRVLIIGAGVSGIATSIRLRNLGMDVTVLERNETYGGKLDEMRLGDYRFDLGPSLFTMPHLVTELLEDSDGQNKSNFNYVPLDELCTYYFNSELKLTAHRDIDYYASEIDRILGSDGAEVKAYFKEVKTLYEITNHIFLEKSLHKLSSYLNWATFISILKLYKLRLFTSLAKYNRRYFSSAEIIKIFNRYATYNGSNPYHCPATMRIIPHLEQNIGTFFPLSGMRSIVTSLYEKSLALGVEYKFKSPVTKISIHKGRADGIHLKNDILEADAIVSAIDVNYTYSHLLKDYNIKHHSLKNPLSSSAIIFYWAINTETELGLHNILFSENYKAEFNQIFKEKSIPTDPTIYIHVSSKLKTDDAPQGGGKLVYND